jgi:hypothetical protein
MLEYNDSITRGSHLGIPKTPKFEKIQDFVKIFSGESVKTELKDDFSYQNRRKKTHGLHEILNGERVAVFIKKEYNVNIVDDFTNRRKK